jgi:hypothetical protein
MDFSFITNRVIGRSPKRGGLMARKSTHNLPPGIQLDQHSAYWATLEGDDAKLWRQRYPGKSLPRRKAKSLKEALKLQRLLIDDLKSGRDPNAENPKVSDWVKTCIDRKRDLAPGTALRYRSWLTWQIEPHLIGRMRLASHDPADGRLGARAALASGKPDAGAGSERQRMERGQPRLLQ